MKTRSMMLLVVLAVVLCFSATPALFGQTVDIKITTIQLRTQQMGVGIERLAKYATENLGSKVRIRTYPAAQLYTGQEELQAVIKGEIQMAYIIASPFDTFVPATQLVKLPYLCPDIETSYKLWDGAIGKKLKTMLEKKGVALLGVVSSGNVVISNSKHPIVKLDDFKGIKMRSYGPMGANTIKALGAMAIVTASEETYSALQQGVIDGAMTPGSVFLARKYSDVQKYATNPGNMNATFGYLIANNDWWNKLPKDVRGGMQAVIERLIKEQRVEIEQEDKSIFQQIAAKGVQVTTLPPAEQANWRKALQPVYSEHASEIGPELIKEAQQEMDKYWATRK
jgi:TRAP-type C4-dicarboxylate transport system substrate-binding protein